MMKIIRWLNFCDLPKKQTVAGSLRYVAGASSHRVQLNDHD